jgi:hypothetical protein
VVAAGGDTLPTDGGADPGMGDPGGDGTADDDCPACTITHGGIETCDGIDNDCNCVPDDLDQPALDDDCDTQHPNAHVAVWQCTGGACLVGTCETDYYDALGSVAGCECQYTNGGTEACDGIDNDCDGDADDGCPVQCVANQLGCDNGDLVLCDAWGSWTATRTACELGCTTAVTPARCRVVNPVNVDDEARVERALPALLCSSAATHDLTVSANTALDTDTGALTPGGEAVFTTVTQGSGQPDLAIFAYDEITISAGATLTVTGRRALVLLACNKVVIAGKLDVSSRCTTSPPNTVCDVAGPGGFAGGPKGGAGLGPCPGGVGQGVLTSHLNSTGSGGGGYGGQGGAGGSHAGLTVGAGGGICGLETLVPLAGGSGGAGQVFIAGEGPAGDAPGLGGGGGGAVQISSAVSIEVSGTIKAAGGGGGTTGNGGGAGGGAGGAVLLEAPSVTIAGTAVLAANGGGGAGGDCS